MRGSHRSWRCARCSSSNRQQDSSSGCFSGTCPRPIRRLIDARTARAVTQNRHAPCVAIQRRCICWRPSCQLAADPVVSPAVWTAARRGRSVLFLGGNTQPRFAASRSTANAPDWLAQYDGVHTHPAERMPHCRSVFAIARAALALLLLRSTLSQMDVPTPSAYVRSIVTPAERPAAASFTALSRMLLGLGWLGAPLVVCGLFKFAYDLSLLVSFHRVRPEGGSS
jgi:hypothetical protein